MIFAQLAELVIHNWLKSVCQCMCVCGCLSVYMLTRVELHVILHGHLITHPEQPLDIPMNKAPRCAPKNIPPDILVRCVDVSCLSVCHIWCSVLWWINVYILRTWFLPWAGAGRSNNRLLCHLQRPHISQWMLLQQLFPVSAITGGDQSDDGEVAVGAQWTDDRTSKNTHLQTHNLWRLRNLKDCSVFCALGNKRLHCGFKQMRQTLKTLFNECKTVM